MVILARLLGHSCHVQPRKLVPVVHKHALEFSVPLTHLPIPNSRFFSKSSFVCSCLKNKTASKSGANFSLLDSDSIPWERGSTWSTMALYFLFFHIPLGYGGLSIVSYILRRPDFDPKTEVLSLLAVETLELMGTLFLLKSTAKPQQDLANFFKSGKFARGRSWLLATALGFLCLVTLTLFTSALENIFGYKAIQPAEVYQILSSGDVSVAGCFVLYCFIAPLVEELVYRGFLLSSLASTMNWMHALIISSALFSASHFSAENFAELFVIGCVLGCSYSWSGNLTSSIAIHSLYNAFALTIALMS